MKEERGKRVMMREGKRELEVRKGGDGDLNSMKSPDDGGQNWHGQLESRQGAQKSYPNYL